MVMENVLILQKKLQMVHCGLWNSWGVTVTTISYRISFDFVLKLGMDKEVWLKDYKYEVFGLGNRQPEHFDKVLFIEYEMLLTCMGIKYGSGALEHQPCCCRVGTGSTANEENHCGRILLCIVS